MNYWVPVLADLLARCSVWEKAEKILFIAILHGRKKKDIAFFRINHEKTSEKIVFYLTSEHMLCSTFFLWKLHRLQLTYALLSSVDNKDSRAMFLSLFYSWKSELFLAYFQWWSASMNFEDKPDLRECSQHRMLHQNNIKGNVIQGGQKRMYSSMICCKFSRLLCSLNLLNLYTHSLTH